MSLPLGIQNLPLTQPFLTGTPWEYIRLRNESDNELTVTLSGSGGSSLGAWTQDDFFVGNRSFTGQVNVTITPGTPVSSGYVTCDAYATGELPNPGPVPLVRQVGVSGGVSLTNTFSSETLVEGSQVIDVGNPGHTNLFVLNNDGSMTWKVHNHFTNQTFNVASIPPAPGLGSLLWQFNNSIEVNTINFLGTSGHTITDANIVQASLTSSFSLVAHGCANVPDIVIGTQLTSTFDATPGNLEYDKAGSDGTNIRVLWSAGSSPRTILLWCIVK